MSGLSGNLSPVPTMSGGLSTGITTDYNNLQNLPLVNGSVLEGGENINLIPQTVGATIYYSILGLNRGALVFYDNKLYMNTSGEHTIGAFDPSKWNQIRISDLFVNNLNNILGGYYTNQWSSSGSYVLEDIVIYNGLIYVCIVDSATTGTFVNNEWTQISVYNMMDKKIDEVKTSMQVTGTAQGSIATFDDGSANPIKELTAQIEAVQSGSGDPYPAGGGKNKLPLTLDNLKELNTGGTWSSNVYSRNNIAFTVNTDDGGNVTGIKVNGTASANTNLILTSTAVHDDYLGLIMNGCPTTGSSTTYLMTGYNATDSTSIGVNDTGTGATIPTNLSGKQFRLYIAIFSGYQANNLMFYPMLRNSAESATFEPYSNIRPISGWDGANVWVQAVVDPTAEADYSISWQTECGTVYGGNFNLFKDGGKWYCTVTAEKSLLTDSDMRSGVTVSSSTDSVVVYQITISDAKNDSWIIANRFSTQIPTGNAGRMVKGGRLLYWVIAKSELSSYDASGCYDWFDTHPSQFLYNLATPETYTFEIDTEIATLLGNNNIFADCGDVDVEYIRDLNLVINKLLNA